MGTSDSLAWRGGSTLVSVPTEVSGSNPLLAATFGSVDRAWTTPASSIEDRSWGDTLGALPSLGARSTGGRVYMAAVDAPPYYPSATAAEDPFNMERRLFLCSVPFADRINDITQAGHKA